MDKLALLREKNNKDVGAVFALITCAYVFLSFIAGFILKATSQEEGIIFNTVSAICSPVCIFALVFLYGKRLGAGYFSVAKVKKFNPVFIVVALILAASLFFGFGFINDAFSTFLKSLGLNVSERTIDLDSPLKLVLYLFVLAIIPAFFEETLFRGVFSMYNGRGNKQIILGALISGLFFAVYHCSASQLIYQFICGAVFYVLAVKAGSIIPAVIAHFSNNAAILILGYFGVSINVYDPLFICIGIAVLSAVMLLLFFFKKSENRAESERENESGENECEKKSKFSQIFVPFGVFGLALCMIILVANLFVK